MSKDSLFNDEKLFEKLLEKTQFSYNVDECLNDLNLGEKSDIDLKQTNLNNKWYIEKMDKFQIYGPFINEVRLPDGFHKESFDEIYYKNPYKYKIYFRMEYNDAKEKKKNVFALISLVDENLQNIKLKKKLDLEPMFIEDITINNEDNTKNIEFFFRFKFNTTSYLIKNLNFKLKITVFYYNTNDNNLLNINILNNGLLNNSEINNTKNVTNNNSLLNITTNIINPNSNTSNNNLYALIISPQFVIKSKKPIKNKGSRNNKNKKKYNKKKKWDFKKFDPNHKP